MTTPVLDSRETGPDWHDGPVLTPTVPRPSQRRLVVSRRAALRFAATSALGIAAVPLLTGCSEDQSRVEEADALADQAQRARRDAASATAAIAVLPDRAGALQLLSTQRSAHADALEAEIARAAGTYADGTVPTTTPGTSTTAQIPAPPPGLDQLRADLTESQRSAADLARGLTAYRAGLTASISAACATHVAVLLS